MLSSSAVLLMGSYVVSTDDLRQVLSSSSKLFHGLISSDLNPRDHQNYASCWRISRDEVLRALNGVDSGKGTQIYIKLLRSVIDAYIEKSTSLVERVLHAWTAVFVARIWLVWIDTMGKKRLDDLLGIFMRKCDKSDFEIKRTCQQYYLTQQMIYSIELNAHSLIYLICLVIEGKLPPEVLAVERFHSQSCESMFRAARAFSSGCSSGVNFTVAQFLNLTDKLSLYQKIKAANQENSSSLLRFPLHHKNKPTSLSATTVSTALSFIKTKADIEEIIDRAFGTSTEYAEELGMMDKLRENKLSNSVEINKRVRMLLNDQRILDNYAPETTDDDQSEEDLLSFGSAEDDEEFFSILSFHENQNTDQQDFHGMRVVDEIPPHLKESYFKIHIHQQEKYIHKSTACWVLTDSCQKLSSDRTKRVTQAK